MSTQTIACSDVVLGALVSVPVEAPNRVCGPAGFQGSCNACGLTYTGAQGAKELHVHRKSAHLSSVDNHHTPVWANGKPHAWRAPKPSRVHTLEETLALWADFGVEVLA